MIKVLLRMKEYGLGCTILIGLGIDINKIKK